MADLREPVRRLLVKLENFAEGMRLLASSNGDKRLHSCGDELDKVVAEFRLDVADTKQVLPRVTLPGEDAYEVIV